MLCLFILGCRAPVASQPPPYVDDPDAFIDDPGYRRTVLESDLVTRDNLYAQERLEELEAWGELPLFDPPSVPLTTDALALLRAGQPVPIEGVPLAPTSRPETDAEWIALGERVFFEYPVRGDPALLSWLKNTDDPSRVGLLFEDGAWVGFRVFADEVGQPQVSITCAHCHAGREPDGAITGRHANRDLDVGQLVLELAIERARELDSTAEEDLLRLGPGRSDPMADDVFNPYAFPDFGGIGQLPYLHHNANWVNRTPSTLALRCETLFVTATGRRTRIPRVLAYALARWMHSLEPLPPMDPSGPASERGQAVFKAAGCADCHTPPLYTSDRRVTLEEVGTDPLAGASEVRFSGLYRIPSLRGVAWNAPYLHHGAFDTLEAMFDPQRSEPGHPWGLELDQEQREELLAFLRTL